MCAQNGMPACGCSHGYTTDPSGTSTPGMTDVREVAGQPRFLDQITMAAPLKGEVAGGYLVPRNQTGQMMTTTNGGTLALYDDIYGADGNSYHYNEGSWAADFAAGRP
jgi:hypothetical protein